MYTSSQASSRLHVVIIGAGISGLCQAVSCLRQGFKVTVFEKISYSALYSAFPSPTIANVSSTVHNSIPNAMRDGAVCLWPTAVRALDRIGAGAEIRRLGVFSNGFCLYLNELSSGETDADLKPVKQQWIDNGEILCIRRSLLANVLRKSIPLGTIQKGVFVGFAPIDYDYDGKSDFVDILVNLGPSESGKENVVTIRADLLIGADGVHSKVRNAMWPLPPLPDGVKKAFMRGRRAGTFSDADLVSSDSYSRYRNNALRYTHFRGVVKIAPDDPIFPFYSRPEKVPFSQLPPTRPIVEFWGNGSRAGMIRVDKEHLHWYLQIFHDKSSWSNFSRICDDDLFPGDESDVISPVGIGANIREWLLHRLSNQTKVREVVAQTAPDQIHQLSSVLPSRNLFRLFMNPPSSRTDRPLKDRVVLIGDAGHPLSHFSCLSLGVSLAIEDAYGLSRALTMAESRHLTVNETLKTFDIYRRPRIDGQLFDSHMYSVLCAMAMPVESKNENKFGHIQVKQNCRRLIRDYLLSNKTVWNVAIGSWKEDPTTQIDSAYIIDFKKFLK